MKSQCKYDGCDRHVKGLGYCEMHYARFRQHGDASVTKCNSHGYRNHPLYKMWQSMVRRCHSESDKSYHNYGGRGIYVCDRWRNSVGAFIKDMGERPSRSHSIDRIDNDGPYAPDNCRWATSKQQGRNKRIGVPGGVKINKEMAAEIRSIPAKASGHQQGFGKGLTNKQIAEIYGISVSTVQDIRSERTWARK